MMEITKRVEFCAAHRITFIDKCSRVHGHNWRCDVSISGDFHNHDIVVDYSEIKRTINDKFDHKIIVWQSDGELMSATEDSKIFDRVVIQSEATAENLAKIIRHDIIELIRGNGIITHLSRVKITLAESESSSVVI